jgi:hypothetical protein
MISNRFETTYSSSERDFEATGSWSAGDLKDGI